MTQIESYENPRVKAYRYIIEEKCGERKMVLKEITPDLFRELLNVGYLKEGMDGDWNKRWRMTEYGEEQIGAYLELYNNKLERRRFLSELRANI